jgi:hypothetical protein
VYKERERDTAQHSDGNNDHEAHLISSRACKSYYFQPMRNCETCSVGVTELVRRESV